MVNPAYKHLGAKLRFAELTLAQLAVMVCALMGGLVFALYLSPFSAYPTLFISVYLTALPAGAVYMASISRIDVWLLIRSMVRHLTSDGRFLAGAQLPLDGYVILPDPQPAGAEQQSPPELADLSVLWEGQ